MKISCRRLIELGGVAAASLLMATALTAHDVTPVPDASLRAEGGSRAVPHMRTDSAEIVAVVDRFHRALTEGDSATVAELLADDATILETGGIETRSEYLGHHLHSDIAFARAVPRQRSEIRVTVVGDVAWATSSSVSSGRFRDRDVNSAGAELMVLRRTAGAWKVVAIHWSSRTLR
jgi:ketosteroid isomerase-like protein